MGVNYLGVLMQRDDIGFSASHFTIFSASERETLHGHNFTVGVDVYSDHQENGMVFNYSILKKILKDICMFLDEKLLLPAESPFLTVKSGLKNVECFYGDEYFSFPARDVVLLPLNNVTLETLSDWFLQKILEKKEIPFNLINELVVYVGSSKGQKVSRRVTLK